jgi:glucokinase
VAEPCYIGVDLGGTKIAAARVTADGSILERIRLDTRAQDGPDRVIARIETVIGRLAQGQDVKGVGVAAPGPLDGRTGVIYSPPNLPGWDAIPLKERLEQRFGWPVRVENDANAAAWGEYWFGAGDRADPMLYLTVSTGIGGGWILEGKIYRGADTYAGEVGHILVDPDGPPCSCGRRGCLESLAAGWAFAREGRKASSASVISKLAEEKGGEVTAEVVFEAFRRGDEEAGRIVRQAVRSLAVVLSNLIHLFNPRRIVIGGGISRAREALFAPLQTEMDTLLMPAFRGTCTMVPGKLGDDAGVLGAASLWWQDSKSSG